MAYFSHDEADNFGNSGTDFFFLKNDKDTAQVRFLYETIEDIQGVALHEVEVGGKKRYVSCLRGAKDPITVCPLCAANYMQKARWFIPLYVIAEDTVKIWERGRDWFNKLSGLCARTTPLVNGVFDIERQGVAGNSKTKYEAYLIDKDDAVLEDFPEIPEIMGTLVLDKTEEEIKQFLATGNFPAVEGEATANSAPPARNVQRDARKPRQEAADTGVVRRRPPANTREGKF